MHTEAKRQREIIIFTRSQGNNNPRRTIPPSKSQTASSVTDPLQEPQRREREREWAWGETAVPDDNYVSSKTAQSYADDNDMYIIYHARCEMKRG